MLEWYEVSEITTDRVQWPSRYTPWSRWGAISGFHMTSSLIGRVPWVMGYGCALSKRLVFLILEPKFKVFLNRIQVTQTNSIPKCFLTKITKFSTEFWLWANFSRYVLIGFEFKPSKSIFLVSSFRVVTVGEPVIDTYSRLFSNAQLHLIYYEELIYICLRSTSLRNYLNIIN